MVKVKLWFLVILFIILSTVNSSSQASISDKQTEGTGKALSEPLEARSKDESVMADDSFVFPDEDVRRPTNSKNNIFSPTIGPKPPSCANGSFFCTNIEGYPHGYVSKLLKRHGDLLKGFFKIDSADDTELQDRVNTVGDPWGSLCNSVRQTILPTVIQTKSGDWKYVVNSDEFRQKYVVEICSNETKPCSELIELHNGYKSKCVQNFVPRRIVTLNKEGSLEADLCPMPACCSCRIEEIDLSDAR